MLLKTTEEFPASSSQPLPGGVAGLPRTTFRWGVSSFFWQVFFASVASDRGQRGILWRIPAYLWFWLGVCLPFSIADEPIEFNLLRLQSSQEATQVLQAPARFLWDQHALRDATGGVSRAFSLTIWIDRRVDPTQTVSYSPQSKGEASSVWPKNSLGAQLEQAMRTLNLEVGLVENVMVVGRGEDVARMQAAAVRLHDAIHRMDAKLASERRPLQWPELTTPQQLVDQIVKQWGISVDGTLPHDLMHAGTLQGLTTLATQLTLVCGGFDQEIFAPSPRSFAMRSISEDVNWSADYPRFAWSREEQSAIRSGFPTGSLRFERDAFTARGVTNFHVAIQASRPPVRTSKAAARATWSFEITNAPVQAIMDNLATGIGLEIAWDPSCTEELKTQFINLKVDQVPLDELLQKVCDAAGLDFKRQDKKVTLRPK